MCYHRSFIVTEDFKVLSHPTSDHHTEIRVYHKIPDGFHEGDVRHAAVECEPVLNLFDLKSWHYILDQQTTPEWYKRDHQEAVLEVLEQEYKKACAVDSKVYRVNRPLELAHLQYLQKGAVLISNDQISLLGLRGSVEDCTIIAPRVGILDWNTSKFEGNKIVCNEFWTQETGFEHHVRDTGQLIYLGRRRKDDWHYEEEMARMAQAYGISTRQGPTASPLNSQAAISNFNPSNPFV